MFRCPIQGDIIAPNAGEWTGVFYRDDDLPEHPVPVWTTLPAFAEPIPTQVGETLTMTAGVASPAEAGETIEIGTGTTHATFVRHILYEGEPVTIPSSLEGNAMTARCSLSLLPHRVTEFIESGVTISGTEPLGFPDALTESQWTVDEVTSGTPGRRTILVDASVSVPAGYSLVLYSGSVSGTQPTLGATLTPGTPYTTNSGAPVGATIYNQIWWKRTSDDALGNPSNEVAIVIEGIDDTDPPPVGTGSLTPDVTVSGIASVRSQIAAWIADWSGTVPSGKTADDDRVIGINASTSGTFNLSSLLNTQATRSARRIFVRHVGTFTGETKGTRLTTAGDTACSVRHTGPLTILNSRGIHIALMHLRVGGSAQAASNALRLEDSTLCGVTQCLIEAREPSLTCPPELTDTALNNAWSNGQIIGIRRTTACDFTHNLIRYAGQPMMSISGTTDLLLVGNLFDLPSADDMKSGGSHDRFRFERNWASRRFMGGFPGDPHEDPFQHEAVNSNFTNCRVYGNFVANPHIGKAARQFMWFANGVNYTGTRVEQNIALINSNFCHAPEHQGAMTALRYNDMMPARGTPYGPPNRGGHPKSFNYGWYESEFNAIAAMGETGSLWRILGSPVSYASMGQDFKLGLAPWHFNTSTDGTNNGYVVPDNQQTIHAFEPAPNGRLHYSNANPCGAYIRKREIYVPAYRETAEASAGYPVMPFAWPVLGAFHAIWNFNSGVSDGYTGLHDTNGNPA